MGVVALEKRLSGVDKLAGKFFLLMTRLHAALLCLQPQSTVSSLQTALALYNCDHYEW